MTKSANPAMTDPAPSVQPVRAWAVIDKDGEIFHVLFLEPILSMWDQANQSRAPHRGIRVEIREVNDE